MRKMSLAVALMHSPEVAQASDLVIAEWVRLHVHCSEQENGGVIVGCRDWDDRQWARVASVTSGGVALVVKSGLAWWDGESLVVVGYDADGQKAVQAKRGNGGKGGRPRKPQEDAASKPIGSQDGNQPVSAPETSSPLLSSPSLSPEASASGARARDPRTAEPGAQSPNPDAPSRANLPTRIIGHWGRRWMATQGKLYVQASSDSSATVEACRALPAEFSEAEVFRALDAYLDDKGARASLEGFWKWGLLNRYAAASSKPKVAPCGQSAEVKRTNALLSSPTYKQPIRDLDKEEFPPRLPRNAPTGNSLVDSLANQKGAS